VSRCRKIRDPIHGFIEVRDEECDLLDTVIFQRLRRIHQLAMAYLVYPGALHTRFDHSLGVFHVAGRLCNVLKIDQEHARIIRLAALLHDIGHGPFSHVSEFILDTLGSKDLRSGAGQAEKTHESLTEKIILTHPDLERALEEKDREKIAALLRDGLDHRINRDILSGPLDADKQDYLLRDSYFCGVRYGIYDLDQLHNTLCSGMDGTDRIMMVESDGIHALEQYVLAKYYLTTQVYRHKVRLITDNMLIRAIQLGVEEDNIRFLNKLYRYVDGDEFISNYLTWDDQQITVELLKQEYQSTHAGHLFRCIANRRLFKRIFSLRLRDLPGELRTILPERFPNIRGELEKRFAEEFQKQTGDPIDFRHVILYKFDIDSVRTQSRNSEGTVMIYKEPKSIPFEDESFLFRSINEKSKEEIIECYAPVSASNEEREKLFQNISDFAISLFSEYVQPLSKEEGRGDSPC